MGGTAGIPSRPIIGREVLFFRNLNGENGFGGRSFLLSRFSDMEADMLGNLSEIERTALDALEEVNDETALEEWRITHLGRNSALMQVFSGLGTLTKEERPAAGQAANRVKAALGGAKQG